MPLVTRIRSKLSARQKKASSNGVSHDPSGDMAEMGFLDHLEDLRWAIIKGLTGVLVSTIVAVFFRKWIIQEVLLGPKKPDFFMYKLLGIQTTPFVLQNRTVTGQFFADIGTVVVVGLIVGSPVIVYYMWKFIEPGLYPNEKKGLRFSAVFATLFFMIGIAFGYCIITPLALQFFASYQISPEISNEFDISKYFSMVTFWAFGVGILFELPVVIYFLAKLGFVTPMALRKARRYAIIGALILGAIFTPPDPVSQILVATPLLLLYEGSIWIAAVVYRKKEKELAEALA